MSRRLTLRGFHRFDVAAIIVGVIAGLVVTMASLANSAPGQSLESPHPDPVTAVADYGDDISIPIDHVGDYSWVSPASNLARMSDTFVIEPRIIGTADVVNQDLQQQGTPDGVIIRFTFAVNSFEPGASLLIIHAHADRSEG